MSFQSAEIEISETIKTLMSESEESWLNIPSVS